MLVIPAIDLLEGNPVRLRQGDFARVIGVAGTAVGLATAFAEAGAQWLHVVDLDGARNGGWRHLDLIAEMAASVPIPIQAGGGARDTGQIEAALERGVRRVIVGTAAVESPAQAAAWCAAYGDRLAISLDARGGRLMARGWTSKSRVETVTLAAALAAAGASCFVYTDVSRDGTLGGIDTKGLSGLLHLGVPLLVAGGLASYRDLERLREAGAAGAIVGRAILEGRLDLGRAIRTAAQVK
jgi:phosphoribosylformimino-5-aminoimidazole carboxamide ribotide isomerase